MRILSQDKGVMVDNNMGVMLIEGNFIMFNDNNSSYLLGEYPSNEQAKKVLFEITTSLASLYIMPPA